MSRPRAVRALLLDLDDTLYDYAPAERQARETTLKRIAGDLELPLAAVESHWRDSRRAVKKRLGPTASSHSRLLYLAELAHRVGGDALARVRRWERSYWSSFLESATLRAGALEFLTRWRARGGRVAIVTDLTEEVQLWKLEAFDLFPYVDVLVTSEEVVRDKPSPEALRLAVERLGVEPEECLVIGDSQQKDGGGARAIGVEFLRVAAGHEEGPTLEDVAREILAR